MYLWNERHHKALSEIATVSGHRYSTCRVPRSYVCSERLRGLHSLLMTSFHGCHNSSSTQFSLVFSPAPFRFFTYVISRGKAWEGGSERHWTIVNNDNWTCIMKVAVEVFISLHCCIEG